MNINDQWLHSYSLGKWEWRPVLSLTTWSSQLRWIVSAHFIVELDMRCSRIRTQNKFLCWDILCGDMECGDCNRSKTWPI